MKTFFITMAFLGGIFSGVSLLTPTFGVAAPLASSSTSVATYEIKQVYVPQLSCQIEAGKIEKARIDEYARACFDIKPEHIKMIFPSI